MTADWTTCRVVRDRDGGLWSRDRDAGWMNRWRDYYGADIWLDEDRGPLVPILDADGMPVVRTVGDLTARHIGRMVRVGSDTFAPARILSTSRYVSVRGFAPDGQWITTEPLPLSTPCEVLP